MPEKAGVGRQEPSMHKEDIRTVQDVQRFMEQKVGHKYDELLAGAQSAFFASAGATLSQAMQPLREVFANMAVEVVRLQQLCIENGIDPGYDAIGGNDDGGSGKARGAGPVGPATSPTPAESIPTPPSAPARAGKPLKNVSKGRRPRVRSKERSRKRAK